MVSGSKDCRYGRRTKQHWMALLGSSSRNHFRLSSSGHSSIIIFAIPKFSPFNMILIGRFAHFLLPGDIITRRMASAFITKSAGSTSKHMLQQRDEQSYRMIKPPQGKAREAQTRRSIVETQRPRNKHRNLHPTP